MVDINLYAKVERPDTKKLHKELSMWLRRRDELRKVGFTALDKEFVNKHMQECEAHIKELSLNIQDAEL